MDPLPPVIMQVVRDPQRRATRLHRPQGNLMRPAPQTRLGLIIRHVAQSKSKKQEARSKKQEQVQVQGARCKVQGAKGRMLRPWPAGHSLLENFSKPTRRPGPEAWPSRCRPGGVIIPAFHRLSSIRRCHPPKLR